MLAKYYRFRIYNDTDQTLTAADGAAVAIRLMPWKFTSGALAYGTVITDDAGFAAAGTLAADATCEGAVIDNSSNLYWGAKGYFEVTADLTSTDGVVYLLMEESDANGSDWPSDQADFDPLADMKMVCALTLSTDAADEARGKNFDLE